MKLIQQCFQIEKQLAGNRLDQALQSLLPDYSRSRIQNWIQKGFVRVNRAHCKPRQKVFSGDLVALDVPRQQEIAHAPQPVEFSILHQDEDLFVIDKPAGLVVHPAAGHRDGTLVNGLLERDPMLSQVPRAGVVHRLDKDTTGVMVVARNLIAHRFLVEELQARRVKREYVAIARGVVTAGRSIETGIGRHPVQRKKMAVRDDGKPALTRFRVVRKFQHYSLLRLELETGRTHQIRVHMAHINHPLLGDPVYGGRSRVPAGIDDALREAIEGFDRQALHAERLAFMHPSSREAVAFEAPLPGDLRQMIQLLERHD